MAGMTMAQVLDTLVAWDKKEQVSEEAGQGRR